MALSDNYSIGTRERLSMLINEQNGTSLVHGVDFTTSEPKPYGNGLRYNTSLVLYWQGANYGSAQRIFYRRLSLDTINKGTEIPVFKVCKDGFYVNDIVGLINAYFGTGFEEGDLVNDFITDGATSYECRAADTSLAWRGGKLDIKFDYKVLDLEDIILVKQLDGLYPPTSASNEDTPIVETPFDDTPDVDNIWL